MGGRLWIKIRTPCARAAFPKHCILSKLISIKFFFFDERKNSRTDQSHNREPFLELRYPRWCYSTYTTFAGLLGSFVAWCDEVDVAALKLGVITVISWTRSQVTTVEVQMKIFEFFFFNNNKHFWWLVFFFSDYGLQQLDYGFFF